MSMIGNFVRISPEQLASFLQDSSLLEKLVYDEESDVIEGHLDIDKSWDVINFTLTGQTIENLEAAEPPLSQVVFTGQLIDEDQDMGYGPAHYLTPEQVKTLSTALQQISTEDFRKLYDPENMRGKDLYPNDWSDGEEDLSYVTSYFEELKEFYATAANNGQATVSYIS